MKPIEFDIKLTTKELYEFSMRHTYRSASGIFGVFISIGSLSFCALRFRKLDRTAIMALLIIGLLFTVIQPLMLYGKARKQVKMNESINDKLHYEFFEEGLQVSQGEEKVQIKWYELRKKVVYKNAVYIYMSPIRAFIFPKGQCEECFDDLVKLITVKMEEYKDYSPEEELEETDGE